MIPVYFLSLEHSKLDQKYGKTRGKRIGELLGMISGWGSFFFGLAYGFLHTINS
jgi:hypothetical protein